MKTNKTLKEQIFKDFTPESDREVRTTEVQIISTDVWYN
jgi:hypothetical protein